MNIQVEQQKKGQCRLSIAEEMTIYSAAAMKDELLGHLSKNQSLEISLNAVSELDSAGLQIMMMLRQEAQHAGKQLAFIEHSQAVIDVVELLNLAGHFGDPIIIVSGEKSA